MADEDTRHWKALVWEARNQAHANAEHCAHLLDGVLNGCKAILLATEAFGDRNAKLAFVDELCKELRRTVSVDETGEQLEVTVRAIWEDRRG